MIKQSIFKLLLPVIIFLLIFTFLNRYDLSWLNLFSLNNAFAQSSPCSLTSVSWPTGVTSVPEGSSVTISMTATGDCSGKSVHTIVRKNVPNWFDEDAANQPSPRDVSLTQSGSNFTSTTTWIADNCSQLNNCGSTYFAKGQLIKSDGTYDSEVTTNRNSDLTVAQSTGTASNLIADSQNPRWLKYADGRPLFMAGPGDPEDFLYRGTRNADGTRNGDQMTLINKLKGTGANSIYLMAIRSHGGDGNSTHNPFVSSNPANGLDNNILNQWDSWFTEMDKNGIVIFFFLYDDSACVWNCGKGTGTDTVPPEELAFIQGLVNRFEKHDNLIWVVAEEYQEAFTAARVANIAASIRLADDKNHPIAVHKLNGLTFTEFADNPNIDQFAIQYNVNTASELHNGMVTAWNNAGGRYNLNMSEAANWGTGAMARQKAWATALGGAYVMVLGMDIANTPLSDLQDLGRLRFFFESTKFAETAPHDELKFAGTEYVLAKPGESYIAYSSNLSGNMGIKNMSAGIYDFKWFDTTDGSTVSQTNIQVVSGDQSWSKPAGIGNEVVLYIKKTDTIQTPTPTPSPCSLTSASWGAINIVEGSSVGLNIEASGDCNGKTVNLEVRRYGSTFLDDIAANIQPTAVTLDVTGKAQGVWIAEYSPLIPGTDPDYYFNATVSGGNTIRSSDPMLKVSKAILLTPTPTLIPTPTPPVSKAKYEPMDGRIIHGLGQYIAHFYADTENWQQVSSYQSAANKVPAIYSTYLSINPQSSPGNPNIYDIAKNHNHPYILLIGLAYLDMAWNLDVRPALRGEWDNEIRQIGRDVKNLNSPVFIRPGFEFGAGSQGVHANITAADFKNLWIRIYNIFNQEGVTNVAWVWNAVNPQSFDYMSYYPGDQYVDWWGINYFTKSQIDSGDGFLAAAKNRNKPVMIPESNPIQNNGTANSANWNNWFVPYFNKIQANTHIKAFVYISDPWNKPGFFDDWPTSELTANSTIQSNYRNEMNKSAYIHMPEYTSNPSVIIDSPTPTPSPVSGSPTPTPALCALTSASWGASSVVEGTSVGLNIEATGDCIGKSVNLEVRRYGSTFLDDIAANIQPTPITLDSTGKAQGTWVAEYNPLIPGTDPDYYFNATVSGGNTIRSSDPMLKVSKAILLTPTPTLIPTPISGTLSITNLTVASGKVYQVVNGGLNDAAVQYIDRSFTFSFVPGTFIGSTYIQTANDDKGSIGTNFLSFDTNQNVTVYVAHDDRITTKPSWLSSFTDTGENLISSGGADPYSLLAKDFPAGKVTLGGNTAEGSTSNRSMYTVIVKGTGTGGVEPTPTPISASPTPTPSPCSLTSASWGATSIVEGTSAGLNIEASGDCNSKTVKLDVRRNITLQPDQPSNNPPSPNPVTLTSSGSNFKAFSSWTGEWVNACTIGTCDPEYFFKANIVGTTTTIESNPRLLTVTKATTGTGLTAYKYDWPTLAHDSKRSGYTETGPVGPYTKVWYRDFVSEFRENVSEGYQPIVVKDQINNVDVVYIGTVNGSFYALKVNTGEILWRYPKEGYIGGVLSSSAVDTATGIVYVGSLDGKVYALNPSTVANGTISAKWIFDTGRTGGFWATPVVSSDTVYIGGRDGYFYAVNKESGSKRWEINIEVPILTSPSFDNNVIYFGAENMKAYAYNTNGQKIWESQLNGQSLKGYYPVVTKDYVLLRSVMLEVL